MPSSATRLRNSEVLVVFRRSRASLCWTSECSMTWNLARHIRSPSRPRLTAAGRARSIPAPRMRRYVLRRFLLFAHPLRGARCSSSSCSGLVPGDIAEILVYQTGSESSAVQKKQIQQIRRPSWAWTGRCVVQYGHWIVGRAARRLRPVLRAAPAGERHPRRALPALRWSWPPSPSSWPWSGRSRCGWSRRCARTRSVDYVARIVSLIGALVCRSSSPGALILYGAGALLPLDPAARVRALHRESRSRTSSSSSGPRCAQAYYISAPITRLTRSQMLEVIRHDYVRTARAKGLAERAVVYRHALGTRSLPVVTFVGWWGGRLLGGARDHGDHLRGARHGHRARAGGQPARLSRPCRP